MSRSGRRPLLIIALILVAVALPVVVGVGLAIYRDSVSVDPPVATFGTVSAASPEAEPQGHATGSRGQLTCPEEGYDESVFDHGEAAGGHQTIEAAIEDFQSWPEWELHPEWHELSAGDMTQAPVAFVNPEGWIGLEVTLVQVDGAWVVAGYEACAPSVDVD